MSESRLIKQYPYVKKFNDTLEVYADDIAQIEFPDKTISEIVFSYERNHAEWVTERLQVTACAKEDEEGVFFKIHPCGANQNASEIKVNEVTMADAWYTASIKEQNIAQQPFVEDILKKLAEKYKEEHSSDLVWFDLLPYVGKGIICSGSTVIGFFDTLLFQSVPDDMQIKNCVGSFDPDAVEDFSIKFHYRDFDIKISNLKYKRTASDDNGLLVYSFSSTDNTYQKTKISKKYKDMTPYQPENTEEYVQARLDVLNKEIQQSKKKKELKAIESFLLGDGL